MIRFDPPTPYAAALTAAYDRLPHPPGEADVTLHMVPDREWPTTGPGAGMTGYYHAPAAAIYLREPRKGLTAFLRRPLLLLTFCHEWGHHRWHHLTTGEHAAWAEAWARLPRQLPTAYARRSATEGWAECVAYLYGPPLLPAWLRPLCRRPVGRGAAALVRASLEPTP